MKKKCTKTGQTVHFIRKIKKINVQTVHFGRPVIKFYIVKSIRSQLYELYKDDMKIIQLFRKFPPCSSNIFDGKHLKK